MAAPRTFGNGLASHPSTYFVGAWSLCALLTSLDLIPRITQYKDSAFAVFVLIVGVNLLGVVTSWFILYRGYSIADVKIVIFQYPRRKQLLVIWIFGSIVEVIVSGGFPLFWILLGNGKTYEDFGVPSIHGVMNAMYLFLTLSAFILAATERSVRSFAQYLLLVGWSVLVVSRALMAIVLLQSATFFLISSRVRLWVKVSAIVIAAALFLLAFGLLGDARADQFSILESTGLGDVDQRFSGLVWVYAYLVSPIANLALNISVDTAQIKVIPTTFLLPLLPSAVQQWLGFETGFYAFSGYLAHDAFNVGTAFIQIYIDWGVFGVVIYDFMLGFVGHAIWRNYRSTGRADILSLFNPAIVLTVFSNQFNQLPVLLMFILFGTMTRLSHWAPPNER